LTKGLRRCARLVGVKILFAVASGYGGLMLPILPLMWAARATGHEILVATRPRLCVTLGTVVPIMTGTRILSAVMSVLGEMDVEVILAAGKADLSALGLLPANVRSVGFLPLSTILATCSLIVHHGGSGTTAAPLHYGIPQLVMPSFADNHLSAQRVVERGVGLSPGSNNYRRHRCRGARVGRATAARADLRHRAPEIERRDGHPTQPIGW
jgi:UDP:flavonoid glycosyltransferase YjiC (YdhE family)